MTIPAGESAKAFGYEGVELRLLDGKIIGGNLPAEQRRRVRTQTRQANMPVIGLDTSVRVAQPDPDSRAEQLREGLALLELAHELEAPFIRVFAGPPSGVSEAAIVASAAMTLEPLARRGRELGVAIALETHDALSSSALVARVLDQLNDPFVGALWDLLHPFRMGETPQETAQRLGKYLLHVHVKDGQRPEAQTANWQLALLGEGDVPTQEMLAALRAVGYDGWLSVEWEKKWHPELAGPEIALPQHISALRAYLSTSSSVPPKEHPHDSDFPA